MAFHLAFNKARCWCFRLYTFIFQPPSISDMFSCIGCAQQAKKWMYKHDDKKNDPASEIVWTTHLFLFKISQNFCLTLHICLLVVLQNIIMSLQTPSLPLGLGLQLSFLTNLIVSTCLHSLEFQFSDFALFVYDAVCITHKTLAKSSCMMPELIQRPQSLSNPQVLNSRKKLEKYSKSSDAPAQHSSCTADVLMRMSAHD